VDHFEYRDGHLCAEAVPLDAVAREVGTPCYVYARATIERHYRVFDEAFGEHPHLVCYAVKANSSLAVLNLLARLGSGFDIVSAGELARVVRAGGDPGKTVFSGVGKTAAEMREALDAGVMCFNVESAPELERLNEVAGAMGRQAPVALRVNPDVDARTHPYIATGLRDNKFGVPIDSAYELYLRARDMPGVHVSGVACHIGSQLTETAPFVDALERVLDLVVRLQAAGIALDHVDVGGGVGIRYSDESPPLPAEYAAALLERVRRRGMDVRLTIEPGRAIVGNAGVLLTRVEYIKHTPHRNFCVVDAAMNDLIRPSLYKAWQAIVPVVEGPGQGAIYDVVGPVCESGDFLGRERQLNVQAGDLLAVRSAGAYGAVMASNYNSRPLVPEVLVDGDRFHVVRRRETLDEMLARESIPAPDR